MLGPAVAIASKGGGMSPGPAEDRRGMCASWAAGGNWPAVGLPAWYGKYPPYYSATEHPGASLVCER